MKVNHQSGLWFWSGAAVYCLINVIFNYKQVAQKEV
jgi:hypothetical protein